MPAEVGAKGDYEGGIRANRVELSTRDHPEVEAVLGDQAGAL